MSGWLHEKGGQIAIYDTTVASTDTQPTSQLWGPSYRFRSSDGLEIGGIGIYYDGAGGVGYQLASRYFGSNQQNTIRVSSKSNSNSVLFSDPNVWWNGLSATSISIRSWASLFLFRVDNTNLLIYIPTERLTTDATTWNVTDTAWNLHYIYSGGSSGAITTDTLTHSQSLSERIGTQGFMIVYTKPSSLPNGAMGVACPRTTFTISKAS